MDEWDEIELEPEEFMIIHEAVAAVAELVAEESHETAEDDESLNISTDSHCVAESQEVLEDAITDKIKVKTEGVDEIEQQEFQAACSSSDGREIGQQPKDEGSSSLQAQGSEKKFQCTQCPNVFAERRYLRRHIKEVHEGKKEHICTECGRGFVRRFSLQNHIKLHFESEQHESQAASSSSDGREIGQQPKDEDNSGLQTTEDDESHNISFDSHCVDESQEVLEDAITDKIKVKTEGVNESEQQKFQAACSSSHGRKIGQQPKDGDSSSLQAQGGGTKFQCKICLKVLKTNQNLKRHIKEVHEGKKEHMCTECEGAFVSKDKLKQHIKEVHEGKKEHMCTECGLGFVRMNTLKRHIKGVHEGKKEHMCTECGKGFVSKDKLKQHIKEVHERKKEHMCTECGGGFVSKNTLKRHIKGVHEGKKEHMCTECGKGFVSKDKLKRHIKEVHEGKKEHMCTECGKGFVSKDKLKQHMKIHEKEQQEFPAASTSSSGQEIDQQPKAEDSSSLQAQGSGAEFQ